MMVYTVINEAIELTNVVNFHKRLKPHSPVSQKNHIVYSIDREKRLKGKESNCQSVDPQIRNEIVEQVM
jgi:hypothetical protein